jgi:pimeloyl-ACP methyl ester carboxylesterase
VNGIDDLVDMVIAEMDAPCALIAQSMGGVIAVRAALARPDRVTHLILAATSGGMNTATFGAEDWRALVRADYPTLPDWFLNEQEDLTGELVRLAMPVLLLWGNADPISPVGVGQHLAGHFPHADLHIFAGADHDLAYTHAVDVAARINTHLARSGYGAAG